MSILPVFVVLLGLAIGSFLNVCIHRVPEKKSVIHPRSACPSCGHRLRPWENIPVLSFSILKGKCSECKHPISWMYPIVEILTALLLLSLFLKYGVSISFLLNAVFVCMLVTLAVIDLRERILPDRITLPGAFLGLLVAPFQSAEFFSATEWWARFGESLLGALVGGGLLWIVAVLYLKLRKREGMGFGDVKLMAMVGAFIGWRFALFTIFVGSVLGAVIGVAYIVGSRKGQQYELPFGTFLGAAAVIAVLWGNPILDWYLPGR